MEEKQAFKIVGIESIRVFDAQEVLIGEIRYTDSKERCIATLETMIEDISILPRQSGKSSMILRDFMKRSVVITYLQALQDNEIEFVSTSHAIHEVEEIISNIFNLGIDTVEQL